MSTVAERVVAIALTVGLFGLVLELVRRKRLQERYALLWLLTALVLLALAAWKGLLTTVSLWAGIHYPPSMLFVAALGLELTLLLNFSLAVSRLTDHSKVLAQHIALLEQTVQSQGEQIAELRRGATDADSTSSGAERLEPSEARR